MPHLTNGASPVSVASDTQCFLSTDSVSGPLSLTSSPTTALSSADDSTARCSVSSTSPVATPTSE